MRVRRARRAMWLVGGAMMAAIACGCGGGGGGTVTPPVEEERPRTISGQVADATSGRGLQGATVRILDQVGTTDRQGAFSIPRLPRRALQIEISLSLYQTQTVAVAANVDQVEVRLIPTPNQGALTPLTPPGTPGFAN